MTSKETAADRERIDAMIREWGGWYPWIGDALLFLADRSRRAVVWAPRRPDKHRGGVP